MLPLSRSGLIRVGVIFVLVILVLGGYYMWRQSHDKSRADKITNYEACVAAGNPVQESYPATCVDTDGRHFTEVLEQK